MIKAVRKPKYTPQQQVIFEGELYYVSAVGSSGYRYILRKVSTNKAMFAREEQLSPYIGANKQMKRALERYED